MKTRYVNFDVKIDQKDILIECKDAARKSADSYTKYQNERIYELSKSIIQAQKDLKTMKSTILRLESKISNS